MKKIGLNIICNNDARTIGKMLESVRSIIDVIVAVDLDSTDETVSIIRKFGFLSNIPTFVYKRLFDNFCNSRNYALDKLYEVVQELSWQPTQVWGLASDCDEIVQVAEKFGKEQLTEDLYLVAASQDNDYYMKRALFRLSVGFYWENPVHEVLTWPGEHIRLANLPALHIVREPKKSSIKATPEKTWLNYAELLTRYAETGHKDFQTLYHLGETYKAAGDSSNVEHNARKYYLAAEKYYETATELDTASIKEKALAHHDRAQNKLSLGEVWTNIQPLFLLSYSQDMQQAESVAAIIRQYMSLKQWHLARLFSSFAYDAYHKNPPELDDSERRIDKSLYEWKLLFYHYVCCFHTKRKQEAKKLRKPLMKYLLNHIPDLNLPQLLSVLFGRPF